MQTPASTLAIGDPTQFGAGNGHAPDFARSPLTLGVFGLLAGYYVGYAMGLLRWRACVMRAKREREAGAAAAVSLPASASSAPAVPQPPTEEH